ncbi:dipeptide ABC transporter ATP-binding protein [Prauserella cavernicola]|uniref:ABC transporter ATP-binding protein n=1 Tax=Prauserella cavernicola TaxID=2800127 RepID=A0A934QVQ7_9PSEU|nr:ABC transporter ATP-binding protein [Prauserella cavernicola]MBK1789142.1 ABC transporter ATP-binding protein [Prauserella cavernicola]
MTATPTAPPPQAAAPTVRIRDLRIDAATGTLVHGIDLDIAPGERVGLIGESGSGKSISSYALLGLLDEQLSARGDVRIAGVDGNVLDCSDSTLSAARGRIASIVFQEPMTALNPLMRIEAQIAETMLRHRTVPDRRSARRAVLELLAQVKVPDPDRVARAFPHQLSGGQRQRVVIAMALANDPALLICDEPTTALDVTVQAQVLDIISDLVRDRDTALLFISHDLAVVSSVADRVAVMRHGHIVEHGATETVFAAPQHSYTKALLAASDLNAADGRGRLVTVDSAPDSEPGSAPGGSEERPSAGQRPVVAASPHLVLDPGEGGSPSAQVFNPAPSDTVPLIRARGLSRVYPGSRGGHRGEGVHGLRAVSFDVVEGQKLGIVGESGSGKSTLLRIVAALDKATAGGIEVGGTDLGRASRAELRRLREDVAVVFQDPMSSLDPRMKVSAIVSEPLRGVGRAEAAERTREVLAAVGLDDDALTRFPHQFSGGQRQRISIARALITRPRILIADEPVSALDVSVRAQVLNLIADLSDQYDLTLLFISHDLGVVRHVCDALLVMSSGEIVESRGTADLYAAPRHRFTADLVSATPTLKYARTTVVTGEDR